MKFGGLACSGCRLSVLIFDLVIDWPGGLVSSHWSSAPAAGDFDSGRYARPSGRQFTGSTTSPCSPPGQLFSGQSLSGRRLSGLSQRYDRGEHVQP